MRFRKLSFYNFFTNTFIRYLFSYLLIFFVLILGFFTIIRNQITSLYYHQLTVQSQERLDNIAQRFTDEMNALDSISVALKADINVLSTENTKNNYYNYQIFQELNKFSTGKNFINSIIYYNKQYNILVSPGILATYTENDIRFLEDPYLTFDYSTLLNNTSNQLLYLENDNIGYFIFFPSNSVYENHLVFFIIDQWEIKQLCKSVSSTELPAIALVDYEKNIIAGYNTEMLLLYKDIYDVEDGLYPIDNNTSLRVCTDITNGCILLALISNDLLLEQVEEIFQPIYKILIILGGIGLFLVIYSMYCTYLPLKILTRKLSPDSCQEHNQLDVLEQAFTKTSLQNEQMAEKLKNYQLSMQKTILDSIMTANHPEEDNIFTSIDKFYTMESTNHIFTVHMQVPETPIPYERIRSLFQSFFTEDTPCIILEMTEHTVTFLLCYSGTSPYDQEDFHLFLMNLHKNYGYYSAVSNSSFSPMDIPAMYEYSKNSSSLWNQNPVVFVDDIDNALTSENAMDYPYDVITELTKALTETRFTDAERCINTLYHTIDSFRHSEEPISNFFIRYVLFDILYAIIHAMNNCNIKLDSYKNLYLETLYYCRSFSYDEKKEAIKTNIQQLLEKFSEYIKQKFDIDKQLQILIKENFENPDISITYIAEHFHISVAYASLLVKRSTGLNFSEYLWELRLKKAKELLLTTQESVDAISVKVGYLNPSSFRRKFKQEVGITPSTYRELSNHNKNWF